MKNNKFSIIIQILFYILVFSFLLNHSFKYLDPDLGWHLKVGQQILEEKAVPGSELYDYTLENKTWVDHEWLLNVFSYWVYDKFGYISLNIFFALLITIILII